MSAVADDFLPFDLRVALNEIGTSLNRGESVAAALAPALAGIYSLPPSSISRAAPAIARAALLFRSYPGWGLIPAAFRKRMTAQEQLQRVPDAKFLFLFHFDGYLREAALRQISGGLPSPFIFAAVALRLNDWVEPVRAAAKECAAKSFPATSAAIVAQAATALLPRQESWQRWTGERAILDTAFARADVAAALAEILIAATAGPGSRILRAALRHASVDPHLERLAISAKQPAVRALALHSFVSGRAAWPTGHEWKWTDKSLGRRDRVRAFASRELSWPEPDATLLRKAASDRSAMVRRVVLDSLIRSELWDDESRALAQQLRHDRSPSVRERAAFILRQEGPV